MTYLILFVYSIIFVELFIGFKIITDIHGVLQLTGESLNVMRSKSINDNDKERFMRTHSLTMLQKTFKFLSKFIFIFVVILLLNYFLSIFSVEESNAIIASISSFKMMIIVTFVTLIYVWARNVIHKKL